MVGETMKLSDQAVGAVMMALQKSLLEQSDIVPLWSINKLEEVVHTYGQAGQVSPE